MLYGKINKPFVLVFLLSSVLLGCNQSFINELIPRGSIEYIFPPNMDSVLTECLDKLPAQTSKNDIALVYVPNEEFYFYPTRPKIESHYSVSLVYLPGYAEKKIEEITKYMYYVSQRSNRFALIKNGEYRLPIVFDYIDNVHIEIDLVEWTNADQEFYGDIIKVYRFNFDDIYIQDSLSTEYFLKWLKEKE